MITLREDLRIIESYWNFPSKNLEDFMHASFFLGAFNQIQLILFKLLIESYTSSKLI